MSLAAPTAASSARKASSKYDPRLEAFLDRSCPEAFHSVASPSDVFRADPYDVEEIHAEPRARFEAMLQRAARTPAPAAGSILVLLGEAGSGKTHLMGAFRTRTHSAGWGYCGYLQLTTETSNYSRYVLSNLIDCLERPYSPDGASGRSGLARLSAALLEDVPGLSVGEREEFQACGSDVDAARLVDEFADRLQRFPSYHRCDLELIRVMLHLERAAPPVRSRALMWLRCNEMKDADRAWIGQAVPRTDEAAPQKMLADLAQLMSAVHGAPLVLLVDQLEDMANQSLPVERFRRVVDALVAFAESVPSAVVVLACLEDYYSANVNRLVKAKRDRLDRDPEPVKLLGNRTREEVEAMTARRLSHLFDEAGVEVDPAEPLFPFKPEHLAPLAGFRSRDALAFLLKHHQECIAAEKWLDPTPGDEPTGRTDGGGDRDEAPRAQCDLPPLWNDFHTAFKDEPSEDEEEFARILCEACRAASTEAPEGNHFECSAGGRYLEIETHRPDGSVDRRLAAVCNAKSTGPALGKQIDELEKCCGEIPVAVVRTVPFPKSGKALAQIAGMLKAKGVKVESAPADRRRMRAFESFRKQYGARPDFASWQKSERPLSTLPTLELLLQFGKLKAAAKPIPVEPSPEQPSLKRPSSEQPSSAKANSHVPSSGTDLRVHSDEDDSILDDEPFLEAPIRLGTTLGRTPAPVSAHRDEWMQHAAFLGGSGSGKTTAALNVIEQLLRQGIPAVLVDRKGDLCRYADPEAWTRPLDDPQREEARRALRAHLDVAIYTPGDARGRSLELSVVPTGFDEMPEADRERHAQYAAGALGSMFGFKTSDADRGMRVILAKAIETLGAASSTTMRIAGLRERIERRDESLLGAIGGAYPDKYFATLAERLLTLELNNKPLLAGGGELLDVDALLGLGVHARPGRVRLSVVSTRSLGDASKIDFWVAQLLSAVSRWCAKSPRPRLQAVFFFDEADQYLPAAGKVPATKAPMEDLLKRARSAGVGMFLATQSPGDLDYKCKENVRSWFLGRIAQPQALAKLSPLLAGCKTDVAARLPAQTPGWFHLVRESSAQSFLSAPSLLRTEQLSEEGILDLAARSRSTSSPRPG